MSSALPRLSAVLLVLVAAGCGDNGGTEPPPDSAVPATCGDGNVDPGEACDDGADNSDTEPGACRTSCTAATCGDGVVDPGETCDDGADNSDTEPGACRTHCAVATCGDGRLDPDEDCDDGAGNSDTAPDACRTTCTRARCGDGIVDVGGGEHCDLGAGNSDAPGSACFTTCRGVWRFVSIPDFLNYDIGDVSALTNQVNSTNTFHEQAIDFVLASIAAENPDFVLVAGDLVGGHWYADAAGAGVFGPVTTLAEKEAAVALAADTYYPQWLARFASRGLPVHAAIGDHDIGDNPWQPSNDRSQLVDDFKAAWAKHLTQDAGVPRYASRPVGTPYENTAYAFRHKNMLVISADVFHHAPGQDLAGGQGSVAVEITADQLAWIEDVFATAAQDPEIEFLVVQGHTPVIKPVRFQASSNLGFVDGGADGSTSPFWQALVAAGADLYLSGEVHAMTANNTGGVEQVCHGGLMGSPSARTVSYLVGNVYPDRLELELKQIDIHYNPENTTQLWQAGNNRPREELTLDQTVGYTTAGTMVIDHSGPTPVTRDRTGYFLEFRKQPAPGLLVHLPLDEAIAGKTPNLGLATAVHRGELAGGTFVPGKLGNAVAIADAERITAGATPISSSWPRTVSLWVKADPSTSALSTVLTFGNNGTGKKWDIDIDHANGGVVELGIAGGRTTAGAGAPSVTDGQWHHVVTVLPEGGDSLDDVVIYVDGLPIVSTSATPMIDTALAPADQNATGNQLILGHSANSVGFQQYLGQLDDVAIWSRGLGATEIRALFSLAAIGHDAGDVDALLSAFAAQRDVVIDGVTWTYQASGLTGAEGALVVPTSGNQYELHLGGGAGFVVP